MGARAGSPRPRRPPRREPSREIVGAILDAAALLLERDGIDGLTTNAVARVAGVSVGSLYQYFPDKIAIVAELARRIESTALAMAAEEAVNLRDASARTGSAHIASLSCSPSFGSGALRRALLREVPRGWTLSETRSTDATIGQLLTAFFRARSDEVRPLATARAVFVVQHAVEGVGEAVLLRSPDALPSRAVQRELLDLGWAYVAPDGDLEPPPLSETIVVAAPAPPAAELAGRLLAEPSRRQAVRLRAAPSSRRGAETRRAILDAAEVVLARGERDGASAREIAAEARLAVGALYHHFPSVESVIAAVAGRIERRASDDLVARLDAGEAIPSALTGAYEGAANEALRRALLRNVPRRWTENAALEAEQAAIARVARALDGRALRRGDPALMAFAALHAVKSVLEAFFLLEPPELTIAELRAELHELVRRYLPPPS